ncbi:SGNH/GDSL hydrolase family protein [Clostridium sp. 19966]|uniref:SGNH/GDSL hydrolase family protein n=1 Tax=Clostridium sp. 19966 TaxID=2768166 RepID=UPI0028E08C86|nr:SGNH/GDSL hydrolase family protein [Clostridium sp. 19966]MDT8715651.1 SGNH/GDSL hydrolase family protein [Clostridium sp. 19966]
MAITRRITIDLNNSVPYVFMNSDIKFVAIKPDDTIIYNSSEIEDAINVLENVNIDDVVESANEFTAIKNKLENEISALYLIANKKYACFGDSITSDQVTGIGTAVNEQLSTSLVGNFACGYACCSDWHSGDTNITTITLVTPQNTNTDDNVLSNQIRRILQHTTANGAQIIWNHPIDGAFSIDTSIGTGLGHTTDIPEIIYIAIGTNDGKNDNVPINDDTGSVFGQAYSELTRNSIASALRWAIETLQSAYPNVQIFVASPLQADTTQTWMQFNNGKLKRDIIERVCQFCSVYFIDSFNESGFSVLNAHNHGEIHPDLIWKNNITKFVSTRIVEKFINR